ncbi:RAP protein, putative [Plasmodium relictum]|uniref:RAP protein, putative n=1 Tax=Plasmodium relictum TaxID=85471 RepID=A0A1J1HCB3_PLARL|nr:RAP protein, putative [Plasmodium relictum]CRH01217.1 RAP protein, putative [Plasmodium relictum]
MLIRKSRNFFFKFRSCRKFCDNNNYINNSYLNYIQVNKNINDKINKEKKYYKDETKINNENIKNLENFNDLNNINDKIEFSLKNEETNFDNHINNLEVNEAVYSGNDNIKKKNINFNVNENVFNDKNKNKNKILGGDGLHNMDNETLSNTYDSFDEEKIKSNEYKNKCKEENIQEDKINKKNKKNIESSDKVANNNNTNQLHDINDSNNLKSNYKSENENMHDYDDLNGENIVGKFNDLNEDITTNNVNTFDNDPLNIKDSEINDSNYSNDSFDESNFESLSNKKISDSSNTSNDDSEKLIENEEDIPNIFEVDENLSEEEKKEKLKLIKLITEKLAGPLKSKNEDNSSSEKNSKSEEDSIFGDNRPIAIEVDGPSHFYANSNRYTTYTKLKHRILTKLGYNVIHISYIDWRKLRNKSEREEFILKKLKEKNDEFLDDNDRIYYNERMNMIKEDYMKYMKQKKDKSE